MINDCKTAGIPDEEAKNLAPCPFCGKYLRFSRSLTGVFFHPGVVTDTDCFLSGRGVRTSELPQWNKRTKT